MLIAETNENCGEREYSHKKYEQTLKDLRIPIIVIGTIAIISLLLYNNFTNNWQYNFLLITKLLGTIVSSLLLWQSIDKNNPFIRNLCQVGGKKSDCNSILNSKAAQLTSWLSWSEIGFFYFAGGFITLLLVPPSGVRELLLLAVGAIFYTIWSIYYQGVVAKQWCSLCLAIQGIILIEFLIALNTMSVEKVFNSPIGGWGAFVAAVGSVILFWVFLKPILQKSQQIEPLKNDLRRFKNNPDLFLSLLERQPEMPFVADYMQAIIIGNPEAEHTLAMVTNPFCQPCAKTHKIVEGLLETNENLRCQVIFAASNNEGDKRGVVARSILSLPTERQADALTEWYKNEERSVEKWQKQLGIIEDKNTKKLIEHHTVWCELAKIEGTPTLYLNGFKIPELYRLEDLKSILKYLPTTDFAKS